MWALPIIVADSILLPDYNSVLWALSLVFFGVLLWALAWGNIKKQGQFWCYRIVWTRCLHFNHVYVLMNMFFCLSSMMSGALERPSRSGSSRVSVSATWSKGQRGCCQGRDLMLSALAHRSVLYGLSQEFRHQVEECLFLGANMCRFRFAFRSFFGMCFGYLFRTRLRDQNRTTPRWNATVRFIGASSVFGP